MPFSSLHLLAVAAAATLAKSGTTIAVSPATLANKLTVVPAQNGTSPAGHVSGTDIKVYDPPRDIVDICTQWAAYLYAQDSTEFGKVSFDSSGRAVVPGKLPSSLTDALENYMRRRVS